LQTVLQQRKIQSDSTLLGEFVFAEWEFACQLVASIASDFETLDALLAGKTQLNHSNTKLSESILRGQTPDR
jgi:hypothetical protein